MVLLDKTLVAAGRERREKEPGSGRAPGNDRLRWVRRSSTALAALKRGDGLRDAAAPGSGRPGQWALNGDTSPELWTLDRAAAPANTPGRKADLPASLLHHHLLETAGEPIESATEGSIANEADPDEIIALLESGTIAAGVFLPPLTPKQFALATEDGDLLPPKSTRFLPKLVSGLVWCGRDAEVTAG